MGIKPAMVLLVGEAANNSLQLLQWLKRRGCSCEVAQSYREAFNLVSRTQFDLVLSQYQLPDRTAFPLLDWLVGSPATLFFSARVENGFLWLKMLERGKRCISAPALRSNALPTVKSALVLAVMVGLTFSAVCSAQSSRSAVNVSYDRFEDMTEVSTSELKVDDVVGRKKEKQDLRLHARYVCAGNVSRCRPDKVELMYVSSSTGEHLWSNVLILLVDGKRMRTTTPNWNRSHDEAGHPAEHIGFSIPVEELLTIARAQKVEGKLGQTTFSLNDDNLAAMRALASEMDSPMLRKAPK